MADQLTQVRHAIAALYSSAGDQAAQANLFLQQVQQTEAAWHIGIQLCNVNEPTQVQFFAVSLLLRKVRTCWHATLPSTRQSLCSAFAGLFESALQCTVSTVVMRQLCLLQAAVVDEESGIAPLGLLQQAERILHTQGLVALELLAAMAQESQNFGRLRRERVIKALSSRTYDVLTLLGGLISDALQAGASSPSSNHNQDNNNNNSASIASILIAALGAVNAWLGLTTHPGGCQIGPAELQVRYNRLFRALLWCALSPPQNDEIVSEAALQPLIAVLNSATYGTEDSHDASALNVCIEALHSVASRIDAVPEGIAAIAAQLGAAVADRWPEGAAGQLPGAEELAQLMLMTLERPEPLVTESAIEYFLAINTVPMSQRLRQLQSPLFAELAVRLRRRASYPSDFVDSWDDYCSHTVDDAMPPTTSPGKFSGIDADAFNRLRDLTLPEALEECYGVLRAAYLEDIVSELRVAPSWQRAEACLYALGAVALSIRSRALASPDPLKDPITSQDVATTRQHLRNVLLQLVFNGGNALLGLPKLAETGCWVLEQYAVYLKADDAPLRDAVQCVLRVVRDCGIATRTTATVRATRSAACRSFCALCLRCAPRLNDPVLVAELIKTVDTLREHAVVSSSPAASTPSLTSLTLSPAAGAAATVAMPLEDEKQLMAGLTHLVAALSPEHAEIAASTLAMPLIRQVRASLDDQAGLGSPRIPAPLGSVTSGGMHIPEASMAARTAMKRALHLLAATLKALLPAALSQQPRGDGAVLAGGPAVAVLRTVQDALQLVATTPAWQRDTEVMAALMDVYREAIASSRKRSVELLPAILPAVGAVFTSTALPSCLDVLSEAVESHFQDHQIISGLLQATHTSFEAALPLLAQSQSHRGGGSGPPHGMSPDNQVGLLAAMTNLADSFALYAPAVLWPSALLPTSLALAIVAVQTREGETLTAALSLLSHLLSGQERIADDPQLGAVDMEPLHALLMHHGESLTEALLRALCETCPRQHMRAAADRLRSLVTHRALSSGAPLWLPNALRTCVSALTPPSRDAMTAELQTKVCGLVLAGALRPARLTALLVDFGLIARREESEDALLAYEM